MFSLQLTVRNQEEVLRQKDIRINQQAATIQIHSDEIAKTQKRPGKFETTPIRYPSQQGLQRAFHNQGPPPAYEQPAQLKLEAGPHYRTRWGDIPQESGMRPTSAVESDMFSHFNGTRVYTPDRSRRHQTDDSGSPLSIGRPGGMSLTNWTDSNSRTNFTTPPRPSQLPVGISDARHTPGPLRNTGQIPMPPAPPQTPTPSESVVSKPRSTKEGAVMSCPSTSKEAISTKAFSDLFDHIVEFSYYFVNVPSTHADSNLPQELKLRLMNAATKTTAHKIMSSQSTRYLLIAKIIISWMQVNVFREQAFFGLDRSIDEAIIAARKKIFNNTPAPVRFVFLRDIANQFAQLRKADNYEDFVNSHSHKRASELWNIVRPLMYNKADGDWQSMHNLMKEAHKVAEMQLLDTAEFRLFFPKIHDPFNDASMINMDSGFDHMTPDEIMVRRASVQLGAIPQVMARITNADGSIMTKTLIKAGVLLKFGGGDPKK